jgi:ribose 5-phosphate isomerase B
LTLGARVIGPALATDLVRAFVEAKFSGDERHVRRVGKIGAIEERFNAVKENVNG